MDEPDHPVILAWPPLLFTAMVVSGYFVHRVDPIVLGPLLPARGVAGAVALVSCALATWAGLAMKAEGTAIHPSHPTTVIVSRGPYSHTRNPMYVALCLLAFSAGLWSGDLWMLMAVPLLACTLHWGVIRREERYLSRKFGAPYRAYCVAVRRWL